MSKKQPWRTGNCFDRSFQRQQEEPQWTLVHGVPLGTGGEAEGLRYPHAWLELGPMCWDPNADLYVDEEAYYRLGSIDPQQCRRYSRADAARAALESGHMGPWDADLRALDDDIDKKMRKKRRK